MTQTYYPFDAGQGANVTEAQWQNMAQYWMKTGVLKGVLNEFQVYADSTGMQCKVKSGNAWMKGHFFQSDAETVMPIATADASNPRIDRVVIRVDWAANTISLNVLQGTPATSPTAPTLTQNTSRWEISLAQVRVNTNVTTVASTNITDERSFVQNANAIQDSYTTLTLQNGWVPSDPNMYPTKILKTTTGMVFFNGGRIKGGTTTNGVTVTNIPVGLRPKGHVLWQQGNIVWELDDTSGNLTAWGLGTGDNTVGVVTWKAEQ